VLPAGGRVPHPPHQVRGRGRQLCGRAGAGGRAQRPHQLPGGQGAAAAARPALLAARVRPAPAQGSLLVKP
jgi:hypothetical protein